MKITKKAVASSEEVLAQPDVVEPVVVENASAEAELNDMVLKDAKVHINSAIKCLGGYARRTGDPKAKEAIANLGVILLDLQ